ncbi:MAG TPA: hypothetical protein VF119_08850 [Candidatus Limnocylindrales bacterium]
MALHRPGSIVLVLLSVGCVAGLSASCGNPVPTPSVAPSPIAVATAVTPSAVAVAPSAPTPAPTPERNPAAFIEGVPYALEIDPAEFTTDVTNPYFPLVPGTTWTFDGAGEHVVVTVTDRTREIAGVTTVVVHDQALEDGEVVEDTEDYYAQDAAGNVWYFGEVTGECDGTAITSRAGSWEAGVDGALPGVVMLAEPRVGDVYRQEYLAGEAEDQATILQLDATMTGPTGAYTAVLVTKDVTPLEPDLVEHKSYAPGVGVVREETLSGEPGVVELVSVTTGNATPAPSGPFVPCGG